MRRDVWVVTLLAGGMAATAFAQEMSAKDLFAQLDKNQDGKLEAAEIPDGQFRFFERILRLGDRNQDGSLTVDELAIALEDRTAAEESPSKPQSEKTPSAAPERAPSLDQLLQKFDRNNDGRISRDELPEGMRDRLEPLFERLNTDAISLEQLRSSIPRERPAREDDSPRVEGDWMGRGQHSEPPVQRPFKLMRLLDQDHNGTLSRSEWEAASKVFGELDANQDGELTPGELLGFGEFRPGFRREEGRPGDGSRFPEELFRRMDANGDGKVSPEEAPARLRESFSTLDEDKDGLLTLPELRSGLPRLRTRRQSAP